MDENNIGIAKKTKKNIFAILKHKLFNIIIIPYDAKYKSIHWRISFIKLTSIVLLLLFSLATILYSSAALVLLNYKIAKLEIQNDAKKQYISSYEDRLRNYLVEYAPKKNYIESQTVFLPNNNLPKNLNIGGNEIKWNKDNQQLIEAHYKKTRDDLQEKIVNSKHLIGHLQEIESSLAKSKIHSEKISKLFRENKNSISSLPLSWPIKNGLGEISPIGDTKTSLQINTLPGSTVLPTGKGVVSSVVFHNNNTATIEVSHMFGITTKYYNVHNAIVTKDDEVTRNSTLGFSGQNLVYGIAINNKDVSAKDFSFLRY